MNHARNDIPGLILDRLARSEARLLNLTVAVRNRLNQNGGYKGDLTRAIECALRDMIKSKRVIDTDGAYSLARHVVPSKPAVAVVVEPALPESSS